MGKLLFTEDELYSNRPYDVVEDEERLKAEAIKQCRYNISALKWLSAAFFDWQKEQPATVGDVGHAVTIMDAFRWYASYQRERFSENQTYEARELLKEAQRGESVCELISFHPQNIKAILCDSAVIQVAEKALKCWNDILPFKTEQDQQQTPAPAGDQEQSDVVAFEILQKMYDSASEEERMQYFRSRRGRRKAGVPDQDVYFEPALKQFNKANKGGLEMSTFIKIVGRFKKHQRIKNG